MCFLNRKYFVKTKFSLSFLKIPTNFLTASEFQQFLLLLFVVAVVMVAVCSSCHFKLPRLLNLLLTLVFE